MNSIRIGVIGCGRIAQAHMEAVKRLHVQGEVIALADVALERARRMAERNGVHSYVRDYHELLANPAVDAVVICLPHRLHSECSLAAAKAGKHILLEKPMALSSREADAMVLGAKENRITLMVGQSRRFSDAVFMLKQRLSEIGSIIRIISNFLVYFAEPPTEWWKSQDQSGDLITYLQASHSVDFCLWMLQDLPQRVYARAFSRHPKGYSMKDEEDILLEFPNNLTASLHLSLNTRPPLHEILVIGENGSFQLIEYALERSFAFGNRLLLNGKLLLEGEQTPPNYTVQMSEFLAAIREGRKPIASAEEIQPQIGVLEAINTSVRTGEAVSITY